MLLMLLGAHGGGVAGTGAVHQGHVGHVGGGPGWASAAAILLVGYFAWHVLRCADQLQADQLQADQLQADQLQADQLQADQLQADQLQVVPVTPAGPIAVRTSTLRDSRTLPAAHAVLSAAMAVMLLGMI